MDYPAPQVDITPAGELDLSHAYGVGVGPWDVQAVRYAYSQFAPGADEGTALEAILRQGTSNGMRFLTDEDARPAGAANPNAALWDNGSDPAEGLRHELAVRKIALAHFGEHNVRPGMALSSLQEVLAPLYFHHRYELTRAAKAVGGLDYSYSVRGDGQPPASMIPAATQRAALAAILSVLSPETLDLPEPALTALVPRAFEETDGREAFQHSTAPVFDALGAASTASRMAVEALLQSERAARLVDFHRRDAGLPGLEEILDALVKTGFSGAPASAPRPAELRRVIQQEIVSGMIRLAENTEAPMRVRSRVDAALDGLASRLNAPAGSAADRAAQSSMRRTIAAHMTRPRDAAPAPTPALGPPPGDPIGDPIGGAGSLGDCGLGDLEGQGWH